MGLYTLLSLPVGLPVYLAVGMSFCVYVCMSCRVYFACVLSCFGTECVTVVKCCMSVCGVPMVSAVGVVSVVAACLDAFALPSNYHMYVS